MGTSIMAAGMSWEAARDTLKKYRDSQIRNSEEVVELWDMVLGDFSYKLGDEEWVVYEQVCLAACDCGRKDLISICLKQLKDRFPGSTRVARLQAMYLEMVNRFEEAEKIYNKILEDDETNSIARKRLVALYKAEGDMEGAIEQLNKYLKIYMSDHEAWQELCDLYIQIQDYEKAAFCMEELVMSNPHNHLFHQKYAEIRYTQGGLDNLETARRYFSQAAKLNPNNMRALFGLYLTSSYIATNSKKDAREKENNRKYASWAAYQITELYKCESGEKMTEDPHAGLVTNMLESLHISKPTS